MENDLTTTVIIVAPVCGADKQKHIVNGQKYVKQMDHIANTERKIQTF